MTEKPLFLSEAALYALAGRIPTPFYLYDAGGIEAAVRQYADAFSWNAGSRMFFPVKATPTAAILRLLHRAGCGMVCSTGTELLLCERCGIPMRDVLFLPNYPTDTDLKTAARLGVSLILDGPGAARLAKAGCAMETVGLRYNPGELVCGDTVLHPCEQKFGQDDAALSVSALELAALGTRAVGLHAYLCGNTRNPAYLPSLARLLFSRMVRLCRETGLRPAYVNLSGGLGLAYHPQEQPADISASGRQVRSEYDRILRPAGLGETPLYTEPGRVITGPSGILVSRVCSIKRGYRSYMGLDASAADLMRPMLYNAYHHITLLGKDPSAPRSVWQVVGGIAEDTDRFARDRLLPEPEIGDLAVIHDAGAHGHSMGYQYAGKLRCAEYLLQNGQVRCIRRAETPEDYFSTQLF